MKPGEDVACDVTAPPRGVMLQEQRRAGGGRAGTRAANGAGRTPASERDASWLDPQVPPFPPVPSARLPGSVLAASRLRPQGNQSARIGTGGWHRDLCSSWMSN